MPQGQCRLCLADSSLQLSHILPAFLFRWMRETSGNSYLRAGTTPNLRVQDGHKRYWLCSACEALLGRSESEFASKLFLPYVKRGSGYVVYGDWLLKLCVSVSWRVLLFYKDETRLKDYDTSAMKCIEQAEDTWRGFLTGRESHPGRFEQHLYPFDLIEAVTGKSRPMSTNINRYLARAVDMDLCRGKNRILVYSKLGHLLVLGFIRENRQDHWQGGLVHVRKGSVAPHNYKMPRAFFNYLNSKARQQAELWAGVSSRQAEKIDQSLRDNVSDYIGSDEFRAMQRDIEMFGNDAFTPRKSKNDDQE